MDYEDPHLHAWERAELINSGIAPWCTMKQLWAVAGMTCMELTTPKVSTNSLQDEEDMVEESAVWSKAYCPEGWGTHLVEYIDCCMATMSTSSARP
mmetsp:Transcript_120985/g.210458  ORF Transcript_120985/g.210458 Transcript_120985/m.210458 type:complete len:96 (-) Transcript_120985:1661-1948(-)